MYLSKDNKKGDIKMSKKICIILLLVFSICFFSNVQASEIIPLKIGAGSPGGTWFPMMTVTMVVINEHVPGVIASVVPGDAVSNVKNVDSNKLDLGLVYLSTAYEGRMGTYPFEKEHLNIMAIGNYPAAPYQYTVRADSDIVSIKDLYNKNIAVGSRGGGQDVNFQRVLEMYELDYESIEKAGGRLHFLSYDETKSMMKDRLIDMGIFDAYPPDANIVEVEMTFPCRVLNIDSEILSNYLKKYPGILSYKVEKGVYKGQDEDANAIAWAPLLAVNENLPEDLVYNITKAIYEHTEELSKGFKRLELLSAEAAVEGVPIPFHPGARRYFEEKGVL